MSEFDILRSAAAGMDAQRAALDVAARNVAAAEATPDHGGFERLVPRYAVAAQPPGDPGPGDYEPADDVPDDVASVHDSGSPDTDLPVRYLGTRPEHGVDVDAVTEMVAVLDAQRAYESNASVFDIGKRLAERTIDMGRLG
jgi:flagellar basal-body rod protein FlgC